MGAGMLFQATQAFAYEEAVAKGNIASTVLLVREHDRDEQHQGILEGGLSHWHNSGEVCSTVL